VFSIDFRKLLKYQISWKSVALNPSCSMRTDEPSDMTKLIVALRNVVNAPKNPYSVPKVNQVSRMYMDLYSAA